MRKINQIKMETKIREAFDVEYPRPDFIESLRQRIVGRGSHSAGCLRFQNLSQRPVWFFLVIGLTLAFAIYLVIGPQNVHAFIEEFDFIDPGLETVAEAGLVTEVEVLSQFTVQGLDKSSQVITVILDWVYIDEGRLVLGFITEGVPSGLVLDMPTIAAEQSIKQNLTFSRISGEDNPDQIIFSAYDPIQLDSYEKQVDFSVDLPLIQSDDPTNTPLAVFHYALEGVPIRKGKTYESEQSAPVLVDDIEFQFESFLFLPSFTEVTFCVNMSSKEILTLPRSDISLQVGDGPVMYDFLLMKIEEDREQTCVQIGFFDGGTPENEMITLRFKRLAIAIMQYSRDDLIESPEPFHPKH